MKQLALKFIEKFPFLRVILVETRAYFHRISSKKKWRLLESSHTIKLELGSGSKRGVDGWTTVDLYGADINWDLRHGIPLPNESVDRIYSSHLLEHIPYQQLICFLRECRRVMKAEAEFLVCVPNARLYIDAYKEGRIFRSKDTWWKPGIVNTGSLMDQLNYVAYMRDEHKYMFDEENLINTLLQAKFSKVNIREFDEKLDLPERKNSSIYAKAIR